MRRLGGLLIVVLAVSACSGSVDPLSAPIVFTAEQSARYGEAYEVCSASSPAELVQAKNARSAEPQEIATAYSLVYEQKLRVPIYEGCLDALEGRPASAR